jgi:hypothetical protein
MSFKKKCAQKSSACPHPSVHGQADAIIIQQEHLYTSTTFLSFFVVTAEEVHEWLP